MNLPAHISERKCRILEEVFGFEAFRQGQEAVIDATLRGENVLAVMPTGSGKSLCFQIPALVREGLTIVVSPLLALMQDQVSALQLAGVKAETINSSRDRTANVATWRRVAAKQVDILYISPERLMTDRMIEALGRLQITLFVIDEAHCISQWGPAFRPEYDELSRLKDLFPGVPLAAFTATADEITRSEISGKLFTGESSTFVLGFDRPNIRLSVQQKADWKEQLLAFMENHAGECGIVYCLSRKKTETTAEFLVHNGVQALPYHAGMDKAQRDANQDFFMTREGVVMVATIAFGMGIDKPDVRFVLHTDLPGTVEAYYQEFGRAGRDGKPAEAMMLYGLEDIRTRRMFIEEDDAEDAYKRRQHHRLDALLAYCEAPACRRIPLLGYFGEKIAPCGNCDVCLGQIETVAGNDVARVALAAVRGTGQRFGVGYLIDVLRGADSQRIKDQGHHTLPQFAAGKKTRKAEWQSIFRQLVAGGLLRIDIQGYGGLGLTDKGDELLEGKGNFRYRKDTIGRRARKRRADFNPSREPPSGEEVGLMTRLKELRWQLAKERHVPAFIIFHDRTLEDMVRRRPQTLDEFAGVDGVGSAKLQKFGEPFVELIASHQE